jgi:HD-like signal output (HDOD) protein
VRNVLVVEASDPVIEGYRRLLRVYSSAWAVGFSSDLPSAMAEISKGGISVVIADAKTSGLEGFLLELRSRTPEVTRVVLASADVRPDLAVTLSLLAHQTIKKPFIPPQLFELVERTCQVGEALADRRLAQVLGQLGALPALPKTYSSLSEMTRDPNVSLAAVAKVVEADPSITAAVLRIINSAYFGLPRRVSSVGETVRYLGIQPLKNIVLTVEVFEGLATGQTAAAMQQDAIARACAMREVLGRTPMAEAAFASGVLADVGALLLVTRLPIDAQAIKKMVAAGRVPWEAERERLGCNHAELGAAILSRWNLPSAMVEAVALHHAPPESAPAPTIGTALALVTAVEYAHCSPAPMGRQLRADAERLCAAFPTLNLEHVERYFGTGDESVA